MDRRQLLARMPKIAAAIGLTGWGLTPEAHAEMTLPEPASTHTSYEFACEMLGKPWDGKFGAFYKAVGTDRIDLDINTQSGAVTSVTFSELGGPVTSVAEFASMDAARLRQQAFGRTSAAMVAAQAFQSPVDGVWEKQLFDFLNNPQSDMVGWWGSTDGTYITDVHLSAKKSTAPPADVHWIGFHAKAWPVYTGPNIRFNNSGDQVNRTPWTLPAA